MTTKTTDVECATCATLNPTPRHVVQRWRARLSSFRPAGEVINTSKYEVAAIDDDATAKAFVTAHHYSASYPAARFRCGLYRGAELVGVAVFSVPSNPLAFRPLVGGYDVNVELGRFVLLDDVPGNGESWFLGRAFELLRGAGVAGVISFSDPMPRRNAAGDVVFGGHVGTIYQAHNAVYLGRARADTLRLLPDGRTLHNRALAKLRSRDRGWRYVLAQLIGYGATPPANDDLAAWAEEWVPRLTRKARSLGNHKYVWAFGGRERKRIAKSAQKYPKQVDEVRHAA